MRALALLLVTVLLALPAFAGPVKLASPGLSLLNVDEKMTTFYTDHMGSSLKQPGVVELVTPREIASLLGMERQKQLLGCSDGSTCVAELANALGADGVVLGDVARVGTRYQVNLKVISASDGKTLAIFQEGATNEEALLDMLTRGGIALRAQTLKALGREVAVVTPVEKPVEVPVAAVTPVVEVKEAPAAASSGVSRKLAIIPMAVGGAVLVGGVVGLIISENASAELATGSTNGAAARDRGRLANTLGVAGVITGASLAAGGVLWFLLAGPQAPAVSVAPTSSGAAFSVSGSF